MRNLISPWAVLLAALSVAFAWETSPPSSIVDGRQINTKRDVQDTSGVPRPLFGGVAYGVDVSACKLPGKVALTFDDGPNKFTTELLDILNKNNVKATFFINGANNGNGQIQDAATGFPAIIKRMHREGHQIGSHTWSHQDLRYMSAEQRRDQIVKLEMALVDILGFFPTYLRPPFAKWNEELIADLKRFGYHNLIFNLDTKDWEENYQRSRDTFSSAVSHNSPASMSFIALAHDTHEQTVHSYVQYMIDQAREHKYELVTVGECMGDPPSNWYRDPRSGQPFSGPPPSPPSPPAPKIIVVSSALGISSSTSLPSTRQTVFSTTESPSVSESTSSSVSVSASASASTFTSPAPDTTTPSTSSPTSASTPRSSTAAAAVTLEAAPKPNSDKPEYRPSSMWVVLTGGLVMLVNHGFPL